MATRAAHEHTKELEALSDLLDAEPAITELVTQDLVDGGVDPDTGRSGMTG